MLWTIAREGNPLFAVDDEGRKVVSSIRDEEDPSPYDLAVWDGEKGHFVTGLMPVAEDEGQGKDGTGYASLALRRDGRQVIMARRDLCLTQSVPKDFKATMRRPLELGQHSDAITMVQYSPSGAHVVMVGRDCAVKVWEAIKGTVTAEFREKEAVVCACVNR